MPLFFDRLPVYLALTVIVSEFSAYNFSIDPNYGLVWAPKPSLMPRKSGLCLYALVRRSQIAGLKWRFGEPRDSQLKELLLFCEILEC